MKTYVGTIKLNEIEYKDSVIAPYKWVARTILKRRNSGKLLKIKQV